MRLVVALTVAYLLGSVLPAELFARARGVDIREVGTGNPGATNALQQLGLVPGLITGAYDASVGLASMALAWWLGLDLGWIYAAGAVAVLGHVFPVYSRFRGGQGMAATTGMLLFMIGIGLWQGWLSAFGMVALAALAVVVFVLTRSATDVGVAVAPVLVAMVVIGGAASWQTLAFTAGLALYIWVVQLGIARRERLFRLAEPWHSRFARRRSHAP